MGIHTGHRKRVKEKLLRQGTDSFLTHELLEAALFYAVPYQDTNPTAHRLLDGTDGLLGALTRDPQETLSVLGCGEHTAVLIRLLGELGRRGAAGTSAITLYDTREALVSLGMEIAREEAKEATWAVFLDNRFSLLGKTRIFEGYYASASFRPALIAEPALRHGASMVLLVSTHPDRGARVDPYERETTATCHRALSSVGLKLLDHLVVSGSIAASAMESATSRAKNSYRFYRFCNESLVLDEEGFL